MGQSQEFRSTPDDTVVKKPKVVDENLQLTYSNNDQQMRNSTIEDAAYTAYDATEHHKTFQHSQKSYDEVRNRYEQQAYSSDNPLSLPDEVSANPAGSGPINFGTAEASPKWNNTPIALQRIAQMQERNKHLQEQLEDRRGYVDEVSTQLTVGKTKFKPKRRYKHYESNGFDRLAKHGGLGTVDEHLNAKSKQGRLQYDVSVSRRKRTLRDYKEQISAADKRNFKRRVTGRLLFHNAKTLVEDETAAEDEMIGRMKRTLKRTGRAAAFSARRNIRTLRLNDNVYANLELATMKDQVLQDKRDRLLSDAKQREQKKQIKEAQSHEQKKKIKKQMVQQRAREEGGFIRRTKHNISVKRRAKEYQAKSRRKILAVASSTVGLILLIAVVCLIIFLALVAIFAGGSDYYASAVTQNDYSTITDATEYFRNLETDMDEYLNVDRETLETDLETEYGDEIYEYIYDLADFGFSANTLIAYLSAMYGSFILDDVRAELDSIFEEMYTLTIEIKVEDREIMKFNPDTGDYDTVIEAKNICYITLEKKEMEEIVEERLPDDLRFQYDGYWLSTGGQQVYGPVMREDWRNLISSNFGDRVHPITKERKSHNGVDIAVPTGTKIYSAVKGTVILAAYSSSAGNWVKVQTDTGWTVVMMHMDSLAVSAGQQVEKGDFLGYSGNTGNSTGPHLHLEVRDPDDKAINPIFIIPQTCANTGKEADE